MDTNRLNLVQHSFKKQKFKKHFHLNYSIGLILDGVHKLQMEDEDIVVPKGKIKIINPYDLHSADGEFTWRYINIMPDIDTIKSIAQDMCCEQIDCNIRFKSIIDDATANHYFNQLLQAKEIDTEYEEKFIIFISYLLEHYAYQDKRIKKIPLNIQTVLEYIHEHFLHDITLDILASVGGVSKYHLIKLFKEKTGLTPYQYILDMKIEYAAKLLKKGYPLSHIAFECGFSDQSHFIRTFKQYFGYTPSHIS